MAHEELSFELPITVISQVDLGRMLREVESLDGFLLQAAARTGGEKVTAPKTSRMLEETAETNKLNLLDSANRDQLKKTLEEIHDHAPVAHISFASDPQAAFLHKIITWFRKEVHPLLLLQIGLQPSIAAGCILRTENKMFDFSLRRHLNDNRNALADKIKTGVGNG